MPDPFALNLKRGQIRLRAGRDGIAALTPLDFPARHICKNEDIGIGSRGAFYDRTGIVRDIVRTVERGLRPGAIIVLHDIHPWTLAALPKILAAIREHGLRAVSVPELLALALELGATYVARGTVGITNTLFASCTTAIERGGGTVLMSTHDVEREARARRQDPLLGRG